MSDPNSPDPSPDLREPATPSRLRVDDLLTRAVADQVTEQQALRGALSGLTKDIDRLIGRMNAVEDRLRERLELDASVRQWMDQEFTAFAEVVRTAIDNLRDEVTEVSSVAGDRLGSAAERVADSTQRLSEGVERLQSEVSTTTREAADRSASVVEGLSTRLGETTETLTSQIASSLESGLDDAAERVATMVTEATERLRESVTQVATDTDAITRTTMAGLTGSVDLARTELTESGQALRDEVRSHLDRQSKEVGATLDALGRDVREGLGDFVAGIRRELLIVPETLADQRAAIGADVRAALAEWVATGLSEVSTPRPRVDLTPLAPDPPTGGGAERPAPSRVTPSDLDSLRQHHGDE